MKRTRTRYETLEDALWDRVDKRGDDECWLWVGSTNAGGYGQLSFCDQHVFVHTLAYRLSIGEYEKRDAEGCRLCVCHSCDNRRCCNPAHLFLGTQSDNMKDAVAKGRLPYIASLISSGKVNAERKAAERAARDAGRKERVDRGIENPRDEYGRFLVPGRELSPPVRGDGGRFYREGGKPLKPRKRDSHGFFVKG